MVSCRYTFVLNVSFSITGPVSQSLRFDSCCNQSLVSRWPNVSSFYHNSPSDVHCPRTPFTSQPSPVSRPLFTSTKLQHTNVFCSQSALALLQQTGFTVKTIPHTRPFTALECQISGVEGLKVNKPGRVPYRKCIKGARGGGFCWCCAYFIFSRKNDESKA